MLSTALAAQPTATLSVRAGVQAPREVRIDGRPVTLPATVTLGAGAVLLEARHQDFPEQRSWLSLPAGSRVDVVVTMCPLGLHPSPQGGCCPAGQTFTAGRCQGSALCTAPWTPDGRGGCALAACPAGTAAVPAGPCCWPGQRFDFRAQACVGTPDTCPVGTLRSFEGCLQSKRFIDTDGDHLSDFRDKCPRQAEDADGFQDDDGCPEADNDGDGFVDGRDTCPEQAEDRDGFQDGDGCPDPDNDFDGVEDAKDRCPLEAEDPDADRDDDGCPEDRAREMQPT